MTSPEVLDPRCFHADARRDRQGCFHPQSRRLQWCRERTGLVLVLPVRAGGGELPGGLEGPTNPNEYSLPFTQAPPTAPPAGPTSNEAAVALFPRSTQKMFTYILM